MFKIIHMPTLMEVLSESDGTGTSNIRLFTSEDNAKNYIKEFEDSFYYPGEDRYLVCLEDYCLDDSLRLDVNELTVVEVTDV